MVAWFFSFTTARLLSAAGYSIATSCCKLRSSWIGRPAFTFTVIDRSCPARVFGGVTWGVGICCAQANQVTGNWIGTDATGMGHIGNFYQGIDLSSGAEAHQIGPGNQIAYNGSVGVLVHGAATLSNTITANAIYENASKGIETADGGNASLAPLRSMAGSKSPGWRSSAFAIA